MQNKFITRRMMAFFSVIALFITLLTVPALAKEEPTFTIMVYMCGTDLESENGACSEDLMEMISAGLDADGAVTVLVETGGTQEWHMEGIDSSLNQRLLISGDDIFVVDEQEMQNMGLTATLQSFLAYGAKNYPADRYGLILWDHGGGSTNGVCFDELTGDYLSMGEIRDALEGASAELGGMRLSFLGFDACLMATFEMANHLKENVDYMIASEELEPGFGWDYASWLGALSQDPGMDMRELGTVIIDSFVESNLKYSPDEYVTLSLLDLGNMEALTDALETIGTGLSRALLDGELRVITRQRKNMRTFGDFDGENTSDMVDILQFANAYSELSGTDDAAFADALSDVVVYNRYSDNLQNVSGMSILMPFATRDDFQSYAKEYDMEQLYPNYTDFITGYTQMLNGGDYVFEAASSAPAQMTDEDITQAEWTIPVAYDDENIFAYSLQLSDEDMENLSYVEGNLMLDFSEDDEEMYVDLGYLQNAQIDWDNGVVYSMFDGTWPTLEGQIVCMTDQIVTEKTRRSVIDVTVNGEECYLLVLFDEKRPDGEVMGYTEGYNENGMPVRGYEKLKAGDVVVPLYELIYWDEEDNQQGEIYEGDPITVSDQPLYFSYEDLTGSDASYVYSFCLNDIFGDYQFSDFIGFDL